MLQLFMDLQAILHRMERDFPGRAAMGHEYVPAIRMLSKVCRYSFAAQAVGLAMLPISESVCPPSIRGTWVALVLRIIQSATFITMCSGAVHFYVGQIAFVLYFRGSLFLLADFLHSTNESMITKIAKTHAELLRVSERRKSIFSVWNGVIFIFVFSLAVQSTYILIRGLYIPAVNAILPLSVSSTFMMSTIGDVLEVTCERFARAVDATQWYDKGESYKKVLIQIIIRCRKPETLHAKILGAISFPFFISFSKNHYRFVQAMLNMRRD